MHLHWWTVLEIGVGGVWMLTSFSGGGRLSRSGVDPRAGRAALWMQRAMALVLLLLGLAGLLR